MLRIFSVGEMNMQNYTLITDVTCDLDARTYEEMGVVCIPMKFLFGEQEYTHYPDEHEMSLTEFYRRLREGEMAKTTQINPLVYRKYFEDCFKQGKDVCYLGFSSGLSGSCNTASMVARELEEEYPGRKVCVLDTLSACAGEGLVVFHAAAEYRKGMSMDDLIAYVEEDLRHCCHWFTVENLMHLKRGGRLNSFEAIVGSALRIQPILTLDTEGKLAVVAKERGTRNALQYLMRRLREDADHPEKQTIFIAHADCREKAEMLQSMVREAYPTAEVRIYSIGPVIGCHVGNGMCALVFRGARPGF